MPQLPFWFETGNQHNREILEKIITNPQERVTKFTQQMVYQLIEKMKSDELKDILRLRGLRVLYLGKSKLVARVFVSKKQQTTGGGRRFFPVILVPSLFSASFSLQ